MRSPRSWSGSWSATSTPTSPNAPSGSVRGGWDNQLWRLGDDLAVRVPWATVFADVLLHTRNTPGYPLWPHTHRCRSPSRNDSAYPPNGFPGPGSSPFGFRAPPPTRPRSPAPRRSQVAGDLPDGAAPTRPQRGTCRPGPRWAAGGPIRAVRRGARRRHRTWPDRRAGRTSRHLAGRGCRSALDRPTALTPRRPAPGQRAHRRGHPLRIDRLRRPLHRRSRL